MLLHPKTWFALSLVWHLLNGFVDEPDVSVVRSPSAPRTVTEYEVTVRLYATPEEERAVIAKGAYPAKMEIPLTVREGEIASRDSTQPRAAVVGYTLRTLESEGPDDLPELALPVTARVEEGTKCRVGLTRKADVLILDIALDLLGSTSEKAESEVMDVFHVGKKPEIEKVRVTGKSVRLIEVAEVGETISAEFDGWILEAELVEISKELGAASQSAAQPADLDESRR